MKCMKTLLASLSRQPWIEVKYEVSVHKCVHQQEGQSALQRRTSTIIHPSTICVRAAEMSVSGSITGPSVLCLRDS